MNLPKYSSHFSQARKECAKCISKLFWQTIPRSLTMGNGDMAEVRNEASLFRVFCLNH